MSIKYNFRFSPQGQVLQDYIESREEVCMIMGPLGSGKTTGSVQRVFDQMCEQEPDKFGVRASRWVAVRNTYNQLFSSTIKDWCELLHNEKVRLGKFVKSPLPTHYLHFKLPDGTTVKSEMMFIALDRPDDANKMRGTQITGFWLNEVKELSKEVIDMCDGRHGRYPDNCSWSGMIGDTNAPDTDHWYYQFAEEIKPKGWKFFRQPGGVIRKKLPGGGHEWVENPNAENLHNLRKRYYIRQVPSKKDSWIKVNLANEYGSVSTGKPIYEESWDDVKHVSKYPLVALPRFGDLRLGFDFGRTPACIIGQVQKNGKIRVVKELIATGMGIRKFMDEVVMPCLKKDFKKFDLKDIEAYGDPAGVAKSGNDENSPIGILNDEYNLTTYPTATNTPLRRWESVASFLDNDIDGLPAFELGSDCHVLRKGFNGGYQFRRLNVTGEKYSEAADKNAYSHPHDALQYLCQGAQGEINYNWRDKHVDASAYKQAVVADSVTGY